jgi:hypothetical protein
VSLTPPRTPINRLPPGKTSSFEKSPPFQAPSGNKYRSSAKKVPLSPFSFPNGRQSFDRDLNNNPVNADPELKAMIERLDDVNSFRSFKMWKSPFLNRFEEFLSQEGSKPAQDAYDAFRKSMANFVKYLKQVQNNVDKGDLTVERTTVKGRNSLNEMNRWLVNMITEERELIPAKREEEKRRGYTKFHLGAVLVRDGFREYEQMNACCEIIKTLKGTSLKDIADRQHLEEIDNYEKQMKRFRDLMADLGLYDVMMKCWEFGQGGEELIFVDLKTGAIGGVEIKWCIDKKLIHTIKDAAGNDIAYREAIADPEDREAVLGLMKEALKL